VQIPTIRRYGKIIIALACVVLLAVFSRLSGWLPRGDRPAGITVQQCGPGPADDVLRVALFPDPACLPGVIENRGLLPSEESLFIKNHGVRVRFEVVETRERCVQNLLEGKNDIAWATVDGFALSYRQMRHINPVAFYMIAASSGAHGIAATPDIAALPDIAGRTVFCVRHSPSHFLMLQLLAQAGINSEKIKWDHAPTDRIAAYRFHKRKSAVYAGTLAELEAGQAGRHRLILSTADAPGLISRVFIAREALLLERAEQVTAFIRGWQEGLEAMKKDLDETGGKTLQFPGVTESRYAGESSLYAYGDMSANLACFGLLHDSTPGFTTLFSLASRRWGKDHEALNRGYASIAKNSSIIRSLLENGGFKNSYYRKPWFKPLPPGHENRLTLISRPFVFDIIPGRGFSHETLSRNSELEDLAALYPGAFLLVSAAGADNQWAAGALIQEAARALAREYALAPERFFFARKAGEAGNESGNPKVSVALALAPPTGK